jgi:hypothetical protein
MTSLNADLFLGGSMGSNHFLNLLILVKVYAVEVCGTFVFVAFVGVETVRAIRHILLSGGRRQR